MAKANILLVLEKASDADALMTGIEQLVVEAADAPMEAGESRSGNDRIFVRDGIGRYFEVNEPQQTINILHVWRYF